MNAREAYKLVTDKYPNKQFSKCFEYKSVFVFQILPTSKPVKDPDKVFDCLISVDKKTEIIRAFQPFHIPISEYKAGKPVTNFK